MNKLFFAAACACAFSGCAELPQRGLDAQQSSMDMEAPATGSMIARKKPKAAAPAPAQAESGSTAASATQ